MCLTWLSVERLNKHSLKNYLDRQKATAIYIVESWVCHDFNTVQVFQDTSHRHQT
jgi:hypothetical protein